MKRILLTLTMVGLLLPLAPRAKAAAEVSLNFFYDNLSPYGTWIDVGDYGYCFQPNVAVSDSTWRPYSDGYWAYTDAGWTWVSYEDFGWATYHYGRWADLADYGWVWVPGYEWGPAWVSWRTGGDYIGWAPLPPAVSRVYEGRAIIGHVDVEFDIGPLYYNFVDIRYIGEPVLRERLVPPQQNLTIISRTVNVTNITYKNSTVYNYGPSLNRVDQFSTRPVQRLSLQRETAVGAEFQNKRGNFNRVNGNQLLVVAPPIQKAPGKIAPKQVRAKVQQPKIEHGWQGVQNRQQLQDEMTKENAKNVPPPTFQPGKGRPGEGTAQNAPRPNESSSPAQPAPANAGNEQAERAARPAQTNDRGQNENANGNTEQPVRPNNQQNARRPEQRPVARAQSEPRAAQQEQAEKSNNQAKRQEVQRRLERQQAQRAEEQQQQAKKSMAERNAQTPQAEAQQQADRAGRRAEQAQQQSAQPNRRPEEARPQPPGQGNQNAERKEKKKKPEEQPTP
ncbi:MAG: DUF6600 domain-containing protein [Chthoniobacterales bacterium]